MLMDKSVITTTITPLKKTEKKLLLITCFVIFFEIGRLSMRLKELRIQRGVTQQTVADAVGCSTNNYSRYERKEREPDTDMLIRLADYFCVSVDYLICHDRIYCSQGESND
jgi:DNA-binding XRE family transcriptional regulator